MNRCYFRRCFRRRLESWPYCPLLHCCHGNSSILRQDKRITFSMYALTRRPGRQPGFGDSAPKGYSHRTCNYNRKYYSFVAKIFTLHQSPPSTRCQPGILKVMRARKGGVHEFIVQNSPFRKNLCQLPDQTRLCNTQLPFIIISNPGRRHPDPKRNLATI